MAKTKIEWCDYTWSPVTGCSKVSSGCKLCYGEAMDRRQMMPGRKDGFRPWTAPNAAYNVRLHPERLEQPLRWRKPRRVFVNSMSDLFHEQVPYDFVELVFAVMAQARSHTFLLLTKRSKRMAAWFNNFKRTADSIRGIGKRGGIMPEDQLLKEAWHTQSNVLIGGPFTWPLPNVYLGISAEDQRTFDLRVPLLLQTPAAKRFVSLEPLIAEINTREALDPLRKLSDSYKEQISRGMFNRDQVDALREPTLDHIIAGSESGPGRRETDIEWVRSIRDQCVAARIPFFLKQLHVNGKKISLPELDGRIWDEMPS